MMRSWPDSDSLICQVLSKVVQIQHEGDRQEALGLVRRGCQTTKDTGVVWGGLCKGPEQSGAELMVVREGRGDV